MHQLEEEIKEDLDQESDWARFAADRDIELSTKEEKARELQTLIGRTQDLLKNERLRE